MTDDSAVQARARVGGRQIVVMAAAAMLALWATGCGHKEQSSTRSPQTAPQVNEYPPGDSGPVNVAGNGTGGTAYGVTRPALDIPNRTPGTTKPPAGRIAPTPAPAGGVDDEDMEYITTHKPVYSEEGLATWYSAPYKGRKAANGQVFDDEALTAAHRTLPMGSLVVVTNLKTGQSSPMRITDRGPFVEGRILDMTKASARATGVYSAGLVNVRVDVYRTPKPMETGGRWCVQIGAFHSERDALKLQDKLEDSYPDANVIEFSGTDSYWVRIRPAGDNREVAERIVRKLKLKDEDASAYLTRLD
jgi:rare lipoprotein A